eukprot:2923729-Prymnesium_polylepis.1
MQAHTAPSRVQHAHARARERGREREGAIGLGVKPGRGPRFKPRRALTIVPLAYHGAGVAGTWGPLDATVSMKGARPPATVLSQAMERLAMMEVVSVKQSSKSSHHAIKRWSGWR